MMRMHKKNLPARLIFGLLTVCFIFGFYMPSSAIVSQSEPDQFPAIQATSLDNAKLHLPQDFSGQMNLVIISFAREQQQEVDTWIPATRQLQSAHSQLNYYELSTMSRENLLYRWWFNAALRSDTADKNLRSRILTAYVSKRKFLESLHIPNEKQVVAILVDRTGKVFWRTDGACTGEKTTALQAALAANGL
jgi:hypothetical protein